VKTLAFGENGDVFGWYGVAWVSYGVGVQVSVISFFLYFFALLHAARNASTNLLHQLKMGILKRRVRVDALSVFGVDVSVLFHYITLIFKPITLDIVL